MRRGTEKLGHACLVLHVLNQRPAWSPWNGFWDTIYMGHLLGYSRVSTADQNPELQHDALKAAGCWRIFTDHASGAKADRPQLMALLDQLRPGDTLVVWKLDRLGRSVPHLVSTINELHERQVQFRSLTEGFDTTTAAGTLLFHIMGALAHFERDLIKERTHAGLMAARARGRHGGRKPKMTLTKIKTARTMYASKEHTLAEIADTIGVSRTTVYRYLEEQPPVVNN